jgi:hypothetical protein
MDEEAFLVIHRWIKKAEHDLTTARVVLENRPEVTDTVCFHAQQCVEKALKAYLTSANVHGRPVYPDERPVRTDEPSVWTDERLARANGQLVSSNEQPAGRDG